MRQYEFWITGKPAELRKTLERVDLLSINEGEAYLLSGQKNVLRAAQEIQKMGPSTVVIKRGEYGSNLLTPNGFFIAPAYPTAHVVDPTGAGDSFAGALMGYLAEQGAHRDWVTSDPKRWESVLRRAVLAGSVMASFTVEDFSFKKLMNIRIEDLVERQNKLIQMMSLD